MPIYNLESEKKVKLIDGFEGQILHGQTISTAYWQIKEGSILPSHSHVHEQFTHVLSGKLQLTIDGNEYIIEPGVVAVIPSFSVHSGKAMTDCVALDVFSPVREDYKNL